MITAPSFATIYTVTNTNNSGGGSLRQAISDANGGGAGTHTIRFNIPTADPNYNAGRGVFTITLTSDLTKLTRSNVTIDGTTQTAFTGDTNSGMLGTGGTVGRLATAFNQINAPEIEIVSGGGRNYGIWVDADNIVIRGLAVYGFGTDYLNNEHAQILIGSYGSSKGTATIEQCVLGTKADAFADPAPTINDGRGACFLSIDNVTFQNNLVGFVDASGVVTGDGCTNIVVDQNEFRNCGLNSNWYDGVDISWNSVTATITENLVSNNGACGIECWGTSGGIDILRNTIEQSGQSPIAAESSGIRLTGTGNLIENNIIKDGAAQGIIVLGQSGSIPQTPTTQTKISKNLIYNNEGMAIDLLADGADEVLGDGITKNSTSPDDCGYVVNHGNDGIDAPVIDSVSYNPGTGVTSIWGRACPNSTIELYKGSAGNGDESNGSYYGEASAYVLSTTTNGSGIFSTTTSGYSTSDVVTALVIDGSDNTSEFGRNVSLNCLRDPLVWLKPDVGFSAGSWTDQSSHGNDGTNAGDPVFVANSLNFNGAINYDGDDKTTISLPELAFDNGFNHAMVFMVYTPSTAATNIGMLGNNSPTGICNYFIGNNYRGRGNGCTSMPTAYGVTPHLMTYEADEENLVTGVNSKLYFSGSSVSQYLYNETNAGGVNSSFHVGSSGTGAEGWYFQGDIQEFIVYYADNGAFTLPETQRRKVQSYLAIKYGMTLNHDYFDTQGSLIKDVEDGFGYGLAVIGRDDDIFLNQPKSKSSEDIFSIVVESDHLENGQFVSLGHDNDPILIGDDNHTNFYLSKRSWKLENSGDPVEITLSFPEHSDDPVIAVSKDASFKSFELLKTDFNQIDLILDKPIYFKMMSSPEEWHIVND